MNNALIRIGGQQQAMRPRTVTTNNDGIAKIVTAAKRQGNPGIAAQQITELEIFDYLPLVGNSAGQTITFFENVRTRKFPQTNISENKLQPGEMMILKRVWFTIMTTAPGDVMKVKDVQDFDAFGLSELNMSLFNWFNDNVRVVKNKSLISFKPQFNKAAFNSEMHVYEMKSEITIPTQVAFTATLQLPGFTILSEDDLYIGMHCEGIGTILNPKNPY
jgi:hypothetical protein